MHIGVDELAAASTRERMAALMAAQETKASSDGVANFFDSIRKRTAARPPMDGAEERRGAAAAFVDPSLRLALYRDDDDTGADDEAPTRSPVISVLATEPSGFIGYGSTISSLLLLGRFGETVTAVYVDGARVEAFAVESPYALRIEKIPEHPHPPEACLFTVDAAAPRAAVCGGGEQGVAESPVTIIVTASMEGEYAVDAHGAIIYDGAPANDVNVSFTLDGLHGHAWLARRSDYTLVLLAVRRPVVLMETFAPFDVSRESSLPLPGSTRRGEGDGGEVATASTSNIRGPSVALVWGNESALSLRDRRYNQQLLLRQYRNSSVAAGQRLQEAEAAISRVSARLGKITYSSVKEWPSTSRAGFHTSPFPLDSGKGRPPRRPRGHTDGTHHAPHGNGSSRRQTHSDSEVADELPAFAVVSPYIVPSEGLSANVMVLYSIGETTGEVLTSVVVASVTSRRDRYSLTRLLPTMTAMAMVQTMPTAATISRNGLRFVNSNWMYSEWYHTITVNGAFPRTTVVGDGMRVRLHPVRFPDFSDDTDWYVKVDSISGDCRTISASHTEVSCEVTVNYQSYDPSYPVFVIDPMESCGGGVAVTAAVGGHGAAAPAMGVGLADDIRDFTRLFPLVSADETLFKPDNLFMEHPSILSSLRNLRRAVALLHQRQQPQQEEAATLSTPSTASDALAAPVNDLTVTFTYSFVYQNRYTGVYRLHCYGSNAVNVSLAANGDVGEKGRAKKGRDHTNGYPPRTRRTSRGGTHTATTPRPPSFSSSSSLFGADALANEPSFPANADAMRMGERLSHASTEPSDSHPSSTQRPHITRDGGANACEVSDGSLFRHTRSGTTISYAAFLYFNVSCTYPLSQLTNATLRGSLFCGVSLEAVDVRLADDSFSGATKQPLAGTVVVLEVSAPFVSASGEAASPRAAAEVELVIARAGEGTTTPARLRVPHVATAAECLLASKDLYLSSTLAGRRWWTGPGGGGTPMLHPRTGAADGSGPRCSWFITVSLEDEAPSSVCGTGPSALRVYATSSSPPSSPSSSSSLSGSDSTSFLAGVQVQQIYCGSRTFFMDPITALQVRVPLGFIPLLVDLDSLGPTAEEDLLLYHYCVEVELDDLTEGRTSAVHTPLRAADGTFTGGPLIYTIVDTSQATSSFMASVLKAVPGTDTPADARVLGEVQYYTGLSLLYYARGGPAPADETDTPITGRDVTMQLAPVSLYDCSDDIVVFPSAYLPFLHAYIVNDTALALNISADVPGGWYNFSLVSGDLGELRVGCGLSLRVNFSVTGIMVPDFSPVTGGVTITIQGNNLPMYVSGDLYVLLGRSKTDDGEQGAFHTCEVTFASPGALQCTTPPMEPEEIRRLAIGRTRGNGNYIVPLRVALYVSPTPLGGSELFQQVSTADFDDGEPWFYVPYQIAEAVVTDVSPSVVSCMNPGATIRIAGANISSRNILVCKSSGASTPGSAFYDSCTLCLPRFFSNTFIVCDLLAPLQPDVYYVFLSDQVTTPVPDFTITSACSVTGLLPETMYAFGSNELIMKGTDFYPGSATHMVVYVQATTDNPFGKVLRQYLVPITFFNATTIIGRTPDLGSWLTEKATLRLAVEYGMGRRLTCDVLGCGIRVVPPNEMPVITSFSPLYGQAPLTLTVYGRGFRKLESSPTYDLPSSALVSRSSSSSSLSPAQVGHTHIDVGHGRCRIVDALNTRLVCLLEEPCYNSFPNSSLRLVAGNRLGSTAPSVAGSGSNSNSNNNSSSSSDRGTTSLFFACSMSVASVSPSRGSVEGGLPITITGVGFPVDPGVLAVTVAGFACEVTSVTVRTIHCNTTSTTGRGGGSVTGAVTVQNTATSSQSSCCSFTYDADITPTITSVYPLIGVRLSRVTITGTNFLPPPTDTDIAGRGHVYVKIGSFMSREVNVTASVITYTVSQSMFISDTVAVFVPGVGQSAPYHIKRPISEVTSSANSLSPYDFFNPLVTGVAAAAAGSGNAGAAAEGEPMCIEYPRIALLITTPVTEPSGGGFQSRQQIRLVGTNMERDLPGDRIDTFTVHVCGKRCEVTGTNSDGDVLCMLPDYMDEEFIARHKSQLEFPKLTSGFDEFSLAESWLAASSTVESPSSPTGSLTLHEGAAALNLANTALPLCNEERDRAAAAWFSSSFFKDEEPATPQAGDALGTSLLIVLAANMHSRLALYEASLTFAPVANSTIDLSNAQCQLQLATPAAETLTLFDAGASNPLNASMWGTDAASLFTWPPINIGDNTISFANQEALPVSAYVAIRCTGLPPNAMALEDASMLGYQVGLHPGGGLCPVDMITSSRAPQQAGLQQQQQQRMHSCISRIGQSCTTFRYDIDLTPVITGFDKVAVLVSDVGATVTISGENFGSNVSDLAMVILDRAMCLPVAVNNTAIVCSMQGRVSSAAANVFLFANERGQGLLLARQSFFAAVAWSSYLAWMSSGLPTNGQVVVVPAGNTFMLDTSPPPLAGLLLDGALIITDEYDVELTVGLLTITERGALIAGRADVPRKHRFTLTMSEHNEGTSTDEVADLKNNTEELPYTKLINVYGGMLQLHSEAPAVARCPLARDAKAGDTHVMVDCRVTWAAGDEFAITTSSLLTHELETRTIVRRQLIGSATLLTFTTTLLYNHSRGLLFDDDDDDDGDPTAMPSHSRGTRVPSGIKGLPDWSSDVEGITKMGQGAVVVLLTRNVRIRGDTRAETSAVGASLWVHNSASTSLSNVEVYRAGKLGSLMGYAIYVDGIRFPTAKAMLKNCVVHHAYHRALVLRLTRNVLIEGLVALGVEGYGVAAVGTLHEGLAIRDGFLSSLHQSRGGVDDVPTGIYLAHTGVDVSGNEIVAAEGNGVWYSLRSTFITARSRTCPALEPLKRFANNTVHRVRRHGLILFPFHFAMDAACATNLFDETAVTTAGLDSGGVGGGNDGDDGGANGGNPSSSSDQGGDEADEEGDPAGDIQRGWLVDGTPVPCGVLERNVFASCGLNGVYLPPSSGYQLRHSLFADCGEAGVSMDYSHLPTVVDSSAFWGVVGDTAMDFNTGCMQRWRGQANRTSVLGRKAEGRWRRSNATGFRASHGGRVDFLHVIFENFGNNTALALKTQRRASNDVYGDSVPAYFMQCSVLGLVFSRSRGHDAENTSEATGPLRLFAFTGPGVVHDVDGRLDENWPKSTYYFSDSPYMNALPFCEPISEPFESGASAANTAAGYTRCYAPSYDVQLVTVNPFPTVGTGTFVDTSAFAAGSTARRSQDGRCDVMRVTVRYADGAIHFSLTVPSNFSDNGNLAPAFFYLSPQLRRRVMNAAQPLDDAARTLSLGYFGEFLTMGDGELTFQSEANITVELYRSTATPAAAAEQGPSQARCYPPLVRTTVYNSRNNDPFMWHSPEAGAAPLWQEFLTAPTLVRIAVHPRSYYIYSRSVGVDGAPSAGELPENGGSSASPASAATPESDRLVASDADSALQSDALFSPATLQRVNANETLLSILVDTNAPLRSTIRWVGTTWLGKTVTCPAEEECLGPNFPFLKNVAATAAAAALEESGELSFESVASGHLDVDDTFSGLRETHPWNSAEAWLDGQRPRLCAGESSTIAADDSVRAAPAQPSSTDGGEMGDEVDSSSSSERQLVTRQYVIPFGRRVVLKRESADVDGALIIFGELIITSDPDGDTADEDGGDADAELPSSPKEMTIRVGSLAVFGRLTIQASRHNSPPIRVLLGYGRRYDTAEDYLNSTGGGCPSGAVTVSCHNVRRPIRLDENTLLRCGSFYASGTVWIVGHTPAPTVWTAEGVAARGTRATPPMRSLFDPWQAESLLTTYDGIVRDGADRLPQWLRTVPARLPSEEAAAAGKEAAAAPSVATATNRVWQKGDLIAVTSSFADLNGAEVNTAARSAYFTLSFTDFANSTSVHIAPSVLSGSSSSISSSSSDDFARSSDNVSESADMMEDAWVMNHGAVDVNDDWASEKNRDVFSEFAVLTKRVVIDCLIPPLAPRHGCVMVITQQRLPEQLFAPPNFTAIGAAFLHMGKGGQYEERASAAASASASAAATPDMFPGLSFIPGVFVNTTVSANRVDPSANAAPKAARSRVAKAAAAAAAEGQPQPSQRRSANSGATARASAAATLRSVAMGEELSSAPAASFAGCAFVQSYGTPLYSAPRTRMLWVLDSVIWESFGGGIRLDGGGNGTRIEGVLVAGTRYYRRGQQSGAPASLKEFLIPAEHATLGNASVVSTSAMGPVSSLCSLLANYTSDLDSDDADASGGGPGANYDDEAYFYQYVLEDLEKGTLISFPSSVPLPSSVIARGSVLGGSESEGLCIPAERTRAFSGNTAHSSFIGVFLYGSARASSSAAGPNATQGLGDARSRAASNRNAYLYGAVSYLNRYIGLYSTAHQHLTVHGADVFASSLGVVLGVDPVYRSGTTTVANSFLAGFSNCKIAVPVAVPHGSSAPVCQSSMSQRPVEGCAAGTFIESTTHHAAILAVPSFLSVGLAYNRDDPLAVLGGNARRGYREVYTQGSLRLLNVTFGGVGVLTCPMPSARGVLGALSAATERRVLYGAAVVGAGSTPTAASLASVTTSGIAYPNYPSVEDWTRGGSGRLPVTAEMRGAWILRLSALASRVDTPTAYDETIVRDLDGSLYTGIGRRPGVSNPSAALTSFDDGSGHVIDVEPAVYGTSLSTLIDSAGCDTFSVDPTLLRCPDLAAPFQQLVLQSLDNRQGLLDSVVLTLPTLREPIRFSSSAAATLSSAAATREELNPSSLVAIKSIAAPPYITSPASSPTPVAVEVTFTPLSSPDVFLVGVQSCIWALNNGNAAPTAEELLLTDADGAAFATGFLYVTTTLMDPHKRLTVWRDGAPLEPSDDVFLPVERLNRATATPSPPAEESGDGEADVEEECSVDSTSSPSSSSWSASLSYLSQGISWQTTTLTDDITGAQATQLQLRVGCGTQATVHQLAYGLISLYIPASTDAVQNNLIRLVVGVLTASSRYAEGSFAVSRSKRHAAFSPTRATAAAAPQSARGARQQIETFPVAEGDSFFVSFAPHSATATATAPAGEAGAAPHQFPEPPSKATAPQSEHFNIKVEEVQPDLYNAHKTILSLRVEGDDTADYDVVAATDAINGLLDSLQRGSRKGRASMARHDGAASTAARHRSRFSAPLSWLRGSLSSPPPSSTMAASAPTSQTTAAPPAAAESSAPPTLSDKVSDGWLSVDGRWYAALSVQYAVSPQRLHADQQVLQRSLASNYATWHWWRLIVFVVLLPALLLLLVALRATQRLQQRRFSSFFAMLEDTGGSPQQLARMKRQKEAAAALAKLGKSSADAADALARKRLMQLRRVRKGLPDSLALPTQQTDPATSTAAAVERFVKRWRLSREGLSALAAASGASFVLFGGFPAGASASVRASGPPPQATPSLVGMDAGGEHALFPVFTLPPSPPLPDVSSRFSQSRRGLYSPAASQRVAGGGGVDGSAGEGGDGRAAGLGCAGGSDAVGGGAGTTGATPGGRLPASDAGTSGMRHSDDGVKEKPTKRHGLSRARQQRNVPVTVSLPSHRLSGLPESHLASGSRLGGGNGGSAVAMGSTSSGGGAPLPAPILQNGLAEDARGHSPSTGGGNRVSFAPAPPRRLAPLSGTTAAGGEGTASLPMEGAATVASAGLPMMVPSLLVRRPIVNGSGVAPPASMSGTPGGAAVAMPILPGTAVLGGTGAGDSPGGVEGASSLRGETASLQASTGTLQYYPSALFPAGYGGGESEDRLGPAIAGSNGVRGRRQVSFAPSAEERPLDDDRECRGHDSNI